MTNKPNNQRLFQLPIDEASTKCKATSMSHYKTIIARNNRSSQKSQINFKPRLGLIANTLP